MCKLRVDETKLKELLKTAMLEILQEHKDIFSEVLAEIIEDIALEKAIKEGENTESVSREAIFKILENQLLP